MSAMRRQEGWAVVTVLMIVTLMIAFGLATLSFVDTQSKVSGREPVREASFNLAETVLNQEMYLLAHPWPLTSAGAPPSSCTDTSTGSRCPSPTAVQQAMSGTFGAGSTWSVSVRDNLASAGSTYKRSVVDSTPCQGTATAPCTWDSNGDGLLWIRADGTARGQRRAVVALVQPKETREDVPNFAVLAGAFGTSNNGNKVIVDTGGAPLAVRCTSSGPSKSDPCLNYITGQVDPGNVTQTAYTGNLLSSDSLQELRTRATLMKSYYSSGCPASLTGPLVFIENGNCSYKSGTFNSPSSPGVVVMNQGTLDLDSNAFYNGLIYHANGNPPPPANPSNQSVLVTIHGNATVRGAVLIDGNGSLEVGSSGGANPYPNLAFDSGVFPQLIGYGDVGFAPNGFRELAASQ